MFNIQKIKQSVSPKSYYSVNLHGSFGKQTGNGWYAWNGLCPFHNDKRSGSFVINQTTGAFKCFSCGSKGGDIIAFHMKIRGLNFKQALIDLKGDVPCEK